MSTRERQASALKILARFSLEAWRASPIGALAEAFVTVIDGVLPAGVLWVSRGLLDAIASVARGHNPQAMMLLLPWAIALAVLAIVRNLGLTCSWALAGYMRPRINLRLEAALLEAAATMDLVEFERPEYYDRLHRARSALGFRMTNLLLVITGVGVLIVRLVAYFALLWYASPVLGLAVVLPAAPWLALKVRAVRLADQYGRTGTPLRRLMDYLQALLLETRPAPEVRQFGLGDHLLTRWRSAHRGWTETAVRRDWTNARAGIGGAALETLAYAAAVTVLASLIVAHRLDLGAYVVLTGAAGAFQADLQGLLNQLAGLMADLPLLGDLQTHLDLAAKTRSTSGTLPFPRPLRRGLEVRNLRFRYPGSSEDTICGIDLTVRPGETVAIVGENGSGKTTLIKLLLGLYAPTEGHVLYDGTDVRAFAPEELAANFAAVFQDFARFRRPARQELSPGLATLERDDSALWAAAEMAGIDDRFRRLSKGLDTFLDPALGAPGEGTELSGGEWQKVAIARALARDAQVLSLDEPTAALDPEAEVDVYRRFAQLAADQMTFLVSHRIGSARLASRILVMAHGRVVESGTHASLLAPGGHYARLFEAQARWYRALPDADGGAAHA